MSQRQLAATIKQQGVDCSESQLSKIERGLHMPYPRLRAALAAVLHLDIDLKKIEVDA